MFVHTRSSAPKRFANFGWQTRTFCRKKVAKVIAKLESDRLLLLFADNLLILKNKSPNELKCA